MRMNMPTPKNLLNAAAITFGAVGCVAALIPGAQPIGLAFELASMALKGAGLAFQAHENREHFHRAFVS